MKRLGVGPADMQRIEGLAIALMYKRLSTLKDIEKAVFQDLDEMTGYRFNEEYLRDRVSYALMEISKYHTIGSLVESYDPDKHINHILRDL